MENRIGQQRGSRRPDLHDRKSLLLREQRVDALLPLVNQGIISPLQAAEAMMTGTLDPAVLLLLNPDLSSCFRSRDQKKDSDDPPIK